MITGGVDSHDTYLNYQRFFGRGIKENENFFPDGLSASAVRAVVG